jgi:hypothetical protein
MRSDLVLTVNSFDDTTKVSYIIPQRGVDEAASFDSWSMEKPGFHVVKRRIAIEQHDFSFTYQSICVECYFKDPDGRELLFKFIASNDYETNSRCIACVFDGENQILPEFCFSITDFSLDAFFSLGPPIITLYNIKADSGKEYMLELNNQRPERR